MLLPVSAGHRCFVYGTLMSPEVLRTLIGRVPSIEDRPAYLPWGYSRHPVSGRVFPAVIENASDKDRVKGLLLSGITDEELEVFDWFEADEYERRSLPVSLLGPEAGSPGGGGSCESDATEVEVDADVYIWCAGDRFLEMGSAWDFEGFCTHDLKWYLRSTVRPCRDDYDRLKKLS
ncbi:unnamed protein product [Pseudo-nitzschia multistriata]|uniref:Putative gamma-glutamylcyclotransferase n=1 Tax=Pseudo-nitzschia multistriata TaxID=183589 RepID=A0A448YUX8_9STRA|nr:unnamed protein product [Pseudo-nitzschia multistriata]